MPSSFTPKFVDLVRNVATVQGSGPVVPGAAVTGFTGLAEALQPGDQFYYCIQGVDKPAEREVGRGTMQADGTVARDPISGMPTHFTAGTKTIALVAAAEWYERIEQLGGDEVVRPESFGAKGDGVTDDTAALVAMSEAINARGGGVIELRPGAIYRVGTQMMCDPPIHTYYSFPPVHQYPILLRHCRDTVLLRGNGATIQCLDGARYGIFNPDGTPKEVTQGYLGSGAATPYYAMIHVEGCAAVEIENLELDGGLAGMVVNGHFSDAGIQLPASGLLLTDNRGPVSIRNVRSHHHGLDGIQINGPAEDGVDPKEQGLVSSSRFECNGRQGMSVVGGKGWSFVGCAFNYTGKADAGSDAPGKVVSSPAAGVDLEAEGGKEVRDLVFDNCEFVGNAGCGLVADSGTDVDRISVRNSTFIGTSNYALWPNRPGFKFDGCTIAGTVTQMWSGSGTVVSPFDAVQFSDCQFSNDAALSPTGTLFTVNNLLIEGGVAFVRFVRCRFTHAIDATAANGNRDSTRFESCEFRALAGSFSVYGRFSGQTLFHETSAVPGGLIAGKNDAGPSETAWQYRSGGVTTTYGPTVGGAPADGDKGDVAVSGAGSTWTVQSASNGFSVAGALSVAGPGAPLSVSSTNSNGNKIAMQDAGVTVAYFGGYSLEPFRVQNGEGQPLLAINYAKNVDLFGGLSLRGYLLTSGRSGLGYASGAGGSAVQSGSKSATVVVNNPSGRVTLHGEALAAGASTAFTLISDIIAASDTVIVNIASGASAAAYCVTVDAVAAGSCRIHLRNVSAGTLAEQPVLNFAILKAVAA